MLREFGLLLIIGVAAICLNSIVGHARGPRHPRVQVADQGRDFREGVLGRLTVRLGSVPAGLAPVLAIGSLLIFAGGMLVEGKLVLQTDPTQWVNQKSQVIKNLNVLDREVHSSSELGVYVQSKDAFDQTTINFVDDFTRGQLAKRPGHAADRVEPREHGQRAERRARRDPPRLPPPPTSGTRSRSRRADIQLSTVSPSHDAMNVIFRTGPSGLDARAKVVREIRATVHPPTGVHATPSGLAVVGVGLLDNLEANRVILTYLAIVFVFVFLMLRLRSIVRALLSLVPVLIAVGAASLFAYALSLKLSPMTAVGGPLVVAACTEFTSLLLLRFVEERNRGSAPRKAMDDTASRTGRAFIVSGLTAISGVAVIATSSLPLLHDFGEIVALNVAVALLSALVVLPPMLVWADKRNWVSKGLVSPERLGEDEERVGAPV